MAICYVNVENYFLTCIIKHIAVLSSKLEFPFEKHRIEGFLKWPPEAPQNGKNQFWCVLVIFEPIFGTGCHKVCTSLYINMFLYIWCPKYLQFCVNILYFFFQESVQKGDIADAKSPDLSRSLHYSPQDDESGGHRQWWNCLHNCKSDISRQN